MLKPDEIKERLEKVKQLQPWVEARMLKLRDADTKTREICHLLMGRDVSGKEPTADSFHMQAHRGSQRLRELDADGLIKLAELLFPKFADAFRAAWDMHARLPYQAGYGRKPFRAPNRPELLLETRRQFLSILVESLRGYEEDLPWVAAHAAHIARWNGAEQIGVLLAGAIDLGGERGREVEQILRDSAAGTHEIGQFGRHVVSGLLCSSRQDNWEFMEKMLLAAQRQEGLRQAILESVDFSQPDAFRRMLRVIDANNLVRFSATVRAANVWLGLQIDSSSAKYIEETIHTLSVLLDDPTQRAAALGGDDAEKAFFALWSIAFDDAPQAVEPAAKLLSHAKPDTRFIALYFLHMLSLRGCGDKLIPCVDDPDLRVATYAATILQQRLTATMQRRARATQTPNVPSTGPRKRTIAQPPKESGDIFERLERLHARTPEKSKEQKALVWPWLKVTTNRETVADAMVVALGERSPARLLPYLEDMSPDSRRWAADLLGLANPLDAKCRAALLQLVGDAASGVREAAIEAMQKATLVADDLPELEKLLSRKASDLRRGVLSLVLSTDDAAACDCAKRLAFSKNAGQRLAGLDLLSQMKQAERSVPRLREIATEFKGSKETLERDEQVYLDKLLGDAELVVTLDDALGLMDSSKRTPPSIPQKRDVRLTSPAAIALIQSLDELIDTHREETVTVKTYAGEIKEVPLGGITHEFPSVFENTRRSKKSSASQTNSSWKKSLDELPQKSMWLDWWNARPAATKDADGLELARAVILSSMKEERSYHPRAPWMRDLISKMLDGEPPKVRYPALILRMLDWLIAYHTPKSLGDFTLDVMELVLASIPPEKLTQKSDYGEHEFRRFLGEFSPLPRLRGVATNEGQITPEQTRRFFLLNRWTDEPAPGVDRQRNWAELVYDAYVAGFANEHDIMDSLLGPRAGSDRYANFSALGQISAELRRGEVSERVLPIVRRAIDRVLEIELLRGETETAATQPALALKYAGGSAVLIRVLQAIGKDPKLQRSYSWGEESKGKSVVFSHLIRATFPDKDDSPESFSAAMKAAGIEEDALLAVAFYAPQWARFIQAAVGWPMLEEAVWWIHAHTRDTSWRVERETREAWNAEVRKLTPLTAEDLLEGAVDVDWFHRTYEALGAKRWSRLDEFAKYASGGGGHKRAQLFADAMLNKLKSTDLTKDITAKRKQDAVRALGLVPVDKKSRKSDILKRYQTIQEFIRGSRQFGSQRQASEKLAGRIGQENLARTAGYPDPVRLQWAMEGLASADLAQGPVVVKVKDVTVSLAIDSDGLPEVSVSRGEKALKAIPPDVKKNEEVEELIERKTDLRRSASRMRQSLELAMCRGDRFGRDDLQELMGNVVLRPMLERVVFVGEGIAGYPVDGGKGLRNHAGKIEPIKADETLRLAHPVDLLAMKQWTNWQRDCFNAERVQPFKQIFRELYVLTAQEKSDDTFSRRYAGQQVNPRQAMALLGSRGWVAAPEAGMFRTFHDEKIVAWLEFMEAFFTPADVEGLTLEKVRFARRGATEYAKLSDLPPRLFSEVMRDVDLIVSVAHRGGVDPEASASTVELRASLLRETLGLLKIDNAKIKEPHIHIKGTLAEYSVHLGSATTHMLPGGTLFIVPVHSQHRGRIFLPFADEDPKTAEIISKVMLLARDNEIRDPNLLDQIRSRAS